MFAERTCFTKLCKTWLKILQLAKTTNPQCLNLLRTLKHTKYEYFQFATFAVEVLICNNIMCNKKKQCKMRIKKCPLLIGLVWDSPISPCSIVYINWWKKRRAALILSGSFLITSKNKTVIETKHPPLVMVNTANLTALPDHLITFSY